MSVSLPCSHDRDNCADARGPQHHAARPPLRTRGGARRVFGTAGASKRPQSTMRCRRTFPIGEAFSSRAFARSATARRPSSPRRSRRSPRRKRSTAASMTRSTSARSDAGYDLSKLEAQVEKRLAITRGSARRSSTSRRPWRSSISPRSSRISCSPIRSISRAPTQEAAELWRWHACEEIEHKGVAYDTWLHATRDWPRYKRWKVKAQGDALCHPQLPRRPHRGRARADAPGRRDGSSRLGATAVAICGCGPGMFRKIAGAWLKFFLPGFHPWNEDDRYLLARL